MIGIAQKVARNFSDAVRSRGQSYFVKGWVSVMAARPGEVVARVRGTSKYRVRLRMRGSQLLASCTCPYFSPEGEPCKHLWATLLMAEARGLLQSAPMFPVHLVVESPRRSPTVGLPDMRNTSGGDVEPPRLGHSDLGVGSIDLRPSRPAGPGRQGHGDPSPGVKTGEFIASHRANLKAGGSEPLPLGTTVLVSEAGPRANFLPRNIARGQARGEPRPSIVMPSDCLSTCSMWPPHSRRTRSSSI